ncbi:MULTISPECIES: hypothetical protein [unclassified Bradyrhizobium]|uniref:hypothetical protein n=1 Tax=unclassified Bradyrhizobium TaxID=2631580 RepID=UPI003395DD00
MGAKGATVSKRSAAKSPRKPTLVITTCSAGKRCRRPLSAETLRRGKLSDTAAAWIAKLRRETALMPASSLYKGRAFRIAVEASTAGSADLAILSAGLGYVAGGTPIPGYDLTIRPTGPGSIVSKITDGVDAARWWSAVKKGPFSSDPLRDARGRASILVCLSRGYADMVERDLIAISRIDGLELRIFGLSLAGHLDEALRPFVLPYDKRLDLLGRPGTRVDFPQRALLDYVTHIVPASAGTLEADRQAVADRLAPVVTQRPSRKQRRLQDDEIRALVADLIPKLGGASTRVLRHLRDVAQVSCEQSRFAKIFNDVKRRVT